MDSSKLNRHFTFQLNGGSYLWLPTSAVLYHFEGLDKKEDVLKIDQDIGDDHLCVTTYQGSRIIVPSIIALTSRLRYPKASVYKPGYAKQVQDFSPY